MLGNCVEHLEEPETGCLVNITWNTSQSKALIQIDINLPKAQSYSSPAVKKAQECSQESLLEPVPAVRPHPAGPPLSCCAALLEFLPTPRVTHPSLAHMLFSLWISIHSPDEFQSLHPPRIQLCDVTSFMALTENSSVLSEHHRAMFIYFYFCQLWL